MLAERMNQVPRVRLGCFPTPVHRMENLERVLGCDPLYIKRDDLTGLGPGGNKIRSLEFLLGEALAQGCDTVIVAGPLQSNLCTLTACACAKIGLKCITIHNGIRSQRAEGNLLLNQLLNVESHYLGGVSSKERNEYARQLSAGLRMEGSVPYVVENGATTGMGGLGYVAAVLELQEQVRQSGISLKSIYAPGGNGGVAAGLIYGNAYLGFPFDIQIVSVEHDNDTLAGEIRKVFSQMEEILQLPFTWKLEEACRLIDDYRGAGWGENTVESEREVHAFVQLEGIFVENIYTSKVLAGIRDLAAKGELHPGACYLHTGGLGSLFAQY